MSEYKRNRQLLEQFRNQKNREKGEDLIKCLAAAGVNLAQTWDELQTEWNADGTLSRLRLLLNGEVILELSLVWSSDGTVHRIFRR